jgi:putative acetyltransferase
MDLHIRQIESFDNENVAILIRSVLKEHGVDKPGTVYTDPTTDNLYELFQTPGSVYWLAELEGEIVGACGIFPTNGLPQACAELVKLYVSKSARNKGIGMQLMEKSIQSAKEMGYTSLYLETLPELSKAISLYESLGFKKLEQAMGSSGHFACEIWMLKEL